MRNSFIGREGANLVLSRTMTKPILFSGIQPSGQLNIGGYVGAMKPWLALQDEYDCLFCLVDLHTMTVRQDPMLFRNQCYDLFALYLACGLDPEKNTLFVQSHVPAHAELAWILSCFTNMGELSRMTQFKDKSQKQVGNINVGLFTYPVLMAADILLYGTKLVPVGEDQKQHLELARDLAQRFNHYYGEVFSVPEAHIPQIGARIMALQDPTKKMSKSDDNPANSIGLLDPPDVIRKKLKRAVTDSDAEVRYHADKPGVSNLLTLYTVATGETVAALESRYAGQGYGAFKQDLAEVIVHLLAPIQQEYQALREDENYLHALLKSGAERALVRAVPVLQKVQEALGLITRW